MRNGIGLIKAQQFREVAWGGLHPVLVREILFPLAFVVAILATNYALAGLPNVKLFDVMVFSAGYTLGFRRGVTVAVAAWLVYGSFNPWGPTTGPLLAVVAAAETSYVVAGVAMRQLLRPPSIRLGIRWATLGFAIAAVLATVAYDAFTNIYTGWYWAQIAGGDTLEWIGIALFNPAALFFGVMHVGSNVALFGALGPGLVKGVERTKAALGWER